MQRGRHVAARAANLDKIERLKQSGRLKHKYFNPGDRERDACCVFYLDGTAIYTHAGPAYGPEWPPENLMAIIGLTIQALDIELPPPTPTHHVSQSGKEYAKRLREINAHRWASKGGC